ncbi:MAG: agmatinase [Mangrovibacterium sp.]
MKTNRLYAGVETALGNEQDAAVYLQSIPYDGTSTWGKGADKAFERFLDASDNMEIYDIETDSEVYEKGVYILDEIVEKSSPEAVYKTVLNKTNSLLKTNKFLTFIGGEHSVSIGIIEAFQQRYEQLSVLHLDAHSDLRPAYNDTEYNHACALHKASKNGNLVQVGIRSMDSVELPFMNKEQVFFAEDMYGKTDWMDKSIDMLSDEVYITIDLDVLDPAIMPSTGTPEPGGLDWNTTIQYLKKVFERKNVVGFDIVEFAPIDGLKAPDFLFAKLYYKLLSYKFYNNGKR